MSMFSEWEDLTKDSPDDDNDPGLFWIQYILTDLSFKNDDPDYRILERGYVLAALRQLSVGNRTNAVRIDRHHDFFNHLDKMERRHRFWDGTLQSGVTVQAEMVLDHSPPRWIIKTSGPGGSKTEPLSVNDAHDKMRELLHLGGGWRKE